MNSYALTTALKMVRNGRDLCLRPISCVGTGNGVMFTAFNGYIKPELPPHLATLLGRWVVQTIASVEREVAEKELGI